MATITFTVPNNKVQSLVDAFIFVYPNKEKNADGTPKYTNQEWVKEVIRRQLISMEAKYRLEKDRQSIETGDEDPTLVT